MHTIASSKRMRQHFPNSEQLSKHPSQEDARQLVPSRNELVPCLRSLLSKNARRQINKRRHPNTQLAGIFFRGAQRREKMETRGESPWILGPARCTDLSCLATTVGRDGYRLVERSYNGWPRPVGPRRQASGVS